MENQINETKSPVYNFIRKLLRVIIIVIVIVLIILSSMIAFLILSIPQRDAKQRIVSEQFLRQVVDSALNQTDFYKEYAAKGDNGALNRLHLLSDKHYKIELIDSESCRYDYRVYFDKSNSVYVIIYFNWGKPELNRFIVEP